MSGGRYHPGRWRRPLHARAVDGHPGRGCRPLPTGQGLKQIGELALAFGLFSLIGLEREWRQKSAGLRTHTLVGFGAALFLIVSKHGFSDVLGAHVTLDR